VVRHVKLLALREHANGASRCPLSGAKQTWPKDGVRFAYDPTADIGCFEIPQRSYLTIQQKCTANQTVGSAFIVHVTR
jgi:hypothetical protein